VITAGGGSEALICVQQRLPDLVITDYAMPEMSGLELRWHLRSHRETHHIPVILHTGTDLPPSETPPYDALCSKPADLAVLARRIHSLLPATQPVHSS
jgi:two-component system phosphate regulon response regulator PhoB